VLWIVAVSFPLLGFMVLKMFTMNPYAGDEYIYIYQAKLVSEGVAPYSGFAMAHPPLHALFTALVLKVSGYHFLLGRFLPVLWCFAGGILLAVLVRRELGSVVSVVAVALYLLAYEPLRASSHYTGVNMTVALLIGSVLAYRVEAVRVAAALAACAVFTRLYAAPGVLTLTIFAILTDRRNGLRLVAWGAGFAVAGFVSFGIWAGFGEMIHNMVLYHAQKTPMTPGSVAGICDKVLFHNAGLAFLFAPAQPFLGATFVGAYRAAEQKGGLLARLGGVLRAEGVGLLVLADGIAILFLVVLLNMERVWMYYFIPSFPFAAIVGGWLVGRGISGLRGLFKEGPRQLLTDGARRTRYVLGAVVFVAFGIAFALSPLLERRLGYYQREMEKPPADRVHTYEWKDGFLPGFLNRAVRALIWRDERVIGDPYLQHTYYLWHESRVFDIVDDVVGAIERETGEKGEIFGDSGTVPLFALLSGRRIAADEVDTNIQRYRSGNADPEELVRKIDKPTTEMIVLRERFGVAGVRQVVELVRSKYERVATLRSAQKNRFHLFRRKDVHR
jgi:hypothetical protein